MTDQPKPLTDAVLAEIDEEIEKVFKVGAAYPGFGGPKDWRETRWVRAITAGRVSDLVAEVRRFRSLIRRAVGEPFGAGPRPEALTGEPLNDGQCCWCQAGIEGMEPEPHATDCPWSEMVAESERA